MDLFRPSLEAFSDGQTAPGAEGHLGQRDPADADAPDRHHVQANLRAHAAQLAALRALDRETQADFVLPTELARWQRTAAVMQPVVEFAQTVRRNVAAHLDHEFLLDLVAVF